MERNNQKVGLINWIILLVATLASVLVTRYINSTAGWLGCVLMGIGFLVAIVSYFQMRLEERERLEKLEFDELNKAKKSAALFTTAEDTFAAQRSREQFERFFIPGFTILLFLLQCAAIVWEWKFLEKTATPIIAERATIAMSLFGLLALILFILWKYSAGFARLDEQRLLRPVAGYLLLSAYVSFILAANIAAIQAGFPRVDIYVARGFSVILGLIASETLVGLILEIYRPRLKGKAAQLLYESRLVGLFGQPEGILKTAAHTLDYQFGFKVSETWFYRFLEKALAWLLFAQIAILIFSTTFVFMEAGEQGLLERFGKPVAGREILNPGFHFKWPAPIDKVYRFRTEQIQSFNIGIVPDKSREKEKTVLWTVSHYKEEFNLLVASREPTATISTNASAKKNPPVNLLSVSIPVQFQITNLTAWAYHNEAPDELLEKLATREVVRYLVSVDLQEIMSSGRAAAAHVLRERIQNAADQRELG
ncbi:MAG: SPFH domain-containing protein, partial [Limisphaerales bacterium]